MIKLNLEGNTPNEVFEISPERAVELLSEFNKQLENPEEMSIKSSINLINQITQDEQEIGLLLMATGRLIVIFEYAAEIEEEL